MGPIEQWRHISNTDAGLSTSFAARKIGYLSFGLRSQETVQAVHEAVQRKHGVVKGRSVSAL